MIRVEKLEYSVGNFTLNLSLEVKQGEYFVLLGPSGSGKTSFIECVCGLRVISRGRVEIGGEDVTRAEPRKRSIGYVPQDYVLFPNLNVRRNIEFSLRMRSHPEQERELEVKRVSEMLGIDALLGRKIMNLSGGERQRVALARALAGHPRALLLDEPVSALDEETRDSILVEMHKVQRETGTTTVHVCHSLDEMRRVADRVGVLINGELQQVGTPEGIRRNPATSRVARLFKLGSVLRGTVPPGGGRIEFDDFSVPATQHVEGEADVLVRAEQVELCEQSKNALIGRVRAVMWQNVCVHVEIEVGRSVLCAELSRRKAEALKLHEGKSVGLEIAADAIHVFDKRTS